MKKPEKVGRNDPCPCGSGKKYKKCCESQLKHKKFHAEVIKSGPSNLSSLFQRNVTEQPKPQATEDLLKKKVQKKQGGQGLPL